MNNPIPDILLIYLNSLFTLKKSNELSYYELVEIPNFLTNTYLKLYLNIDKVINKNFIDKIEKEQEKLMEKINKNISKI